MKKLIILALAGLILPLASIMAYAETIEGTVQGFRCVTEGKICPIGMEDPYAAIESTFVIQLSGQDYYFAPNVDRNILVRHLNERVRITGKIDPKFKSITVESIETMKNGKWMVTWNKKVEQDAYRIYMQEKVR